MLRKRHLKMGFRASARSKMTKVAPGQKQRRGGEVLGIVSRVRGRKQTLGRQIHGRPQTLGSLKGSSGARRKFPGKQMMTSTMQSEVDHKRRTLTCYQ